MPNFRYFVTIGIRNTNRISTKHINQKVEKEMNEEFGDLLKEYESRDGGFFRRINPTFINLRPCQIIDSRMTEEEIKDMCVDNCLVYAIHPRLIKEGRSNIINNLKYRFVENRYLNQSVLNDVGSEFNLKFIVHDICKTPQVNKQKKLKEFARRKETTKENI